MTIRDRRLVRTATLALVLSAGFVPALRAQGDSPPVEHIVQYRGTVKVRADGNGAVAASFPTTVEGELVRYLLVVDNGCSDPTAARRGPQCPLAVTGLEVLLNGDTVLSLSDAVDGRQRVEIALDPVGDDLNSIRAVASGVKGSAARILVEAIQPAEVPFGGRSVLPWAEIDGEARTVTITAHNSGPAALIFRVRLNGGDGATAGRSAPLALAPGATQNLDLGALATALGLDWTAGPVEVEWAALSYTTLQAVATEAHREPDESGNLELRSSRELALDDYGPFLLNRARVADLFGTTP